MIQQNIQLARYNQATKEPNYNQKLKKQFRTVEASPDAKQPSGPFIKGDNITTIYNPVGTQYLTGSAMSIESPKKQSEKEPSGRSGAAEKTEERKNDET